MDHESLRKTFTRAPRLPRSAPRYVPSRATMPPPLTFPPGLGRKVGERFVDKTSDYLVERPPELPVTPMFPWTVPIGPSYYDLRRSHARLTHVYNRKRGRMRAAGSLAQEAEERVRQQDLYRLNTENELAGEETDPRDPFDTTADMQIDSPRVKPNSKKDWQEMIDGMNDIDEENRKRETFFTKVYEHNDDAVLVDKFKLHPDVIKQYLDYKKRRTTDETQDQYRQQQEEIKRQQRINEQLLTENTPQEVNDLSNQFGGQTVNGSGNNGDDSASEESEESAAADSDSETDDSKRMTDDISGFTRPHPTGDISMVEEDENPENPPGPGDFLQLKKQKPGSGMLYGTQIQPLVLPSSYDTQMINVDRMQNQLPGTSNNRSGTIGPIRNNINLKSNRYKPFIPYVKKNDK